MPFTATELMLKTMAEKTWRGCFQPPRACPIANKQAGVSKKSKIIVFTPQYIRGDTLVAPYA